MPDDELIWPSPSIAERAAQQLANANPNVPVYLGDRRVYPDGEEVDPDAPRVRMVRTVGELADVWDAVVEDDDTCVYCLHPIGNHDNDVPGCTVCGCTRVVFDEDAGT